MNKVIKNQAYWIEQSSLWESSGLPQKKFCEQAGLSYRQFIYWRNRLNEGTCSLSTPKLLKITTTEAAIKSPTIIIEPDSGMEVVLPSGIKLYIKIDADIKKACGLIQLLGVAR